MTSAALISDLTVEIDAGHVVVQQTDSDNDYKIMPAKFFTRSRLELDQAISSEDKTFDDPDGTDVKYKILFYSTLKSCKAKLRALTDEPLLLHRPRGNLSNKNKESRNLDSHRITRSEKSMTDSSDSTSAINSMKRLIEYNNHKLENLLKDLIKRIDSLEERSLHGHSSSMKDPGLSVTDMAMQAMQNCRSNMKWRSKIKDLEIDDLNDEQIKEVKKIMLSGNKFPSKMAISLSKTIFGDMLKTHLLGENGKAKRGARDGERSEVIPENFENVLRDILKNFDDDIFTEQPGWDLLVRGPINQSGREVNRSRNNKRRYDTDSDENDVNKRKKLMQSQSEYLNNSDDLHSTNENEEINDKDQGSAM